MEVDRQFGNGECTPYQSCPTSPCGHTFGSPQFYSAPSSPTRGLTLAPLVGVRKEGAKADSDSEDSDDFMFEISIDTSKRFDGAMWSRPVEDMSVEDLLPTGMSFADELFHNGIVLPSTPPPRRRGSNMLSCPGSPSSVLSGLNSPFMVGLEQAREVGQEVPHRRSRSMSPRRSSVCRSENNPHMDKGIGPLESTGISVAKAVVDPSRCVSEQSGEPKRVGSKRIKGPMRSASDRPPLRPDSEVPVGSKRSSSNKSAGPIRSNSERQTKPTPSNVDEPPLDTSKKKASSRKGWSITSFLFRSASEGRTDPKDKLRGHTAALRETQSDLSFQALHGVHYDSRKGSDEAKKNNSSGILDCLRLRRKGPKKEK